MAISSCSSDVQFGHGLALSNWTSTQVYLYRKGGVYDTVIVGNQIVDYVSQDGLVLVLRKVARSYDCVVGQRKGIITHYTAESEFWVVEIAGSEVIGPLNQIQIDAHLEQRGIVMRRPLNEGSYEPNSALFENFKAPCTSLEPA